MLPRSASGSISSPVNDSSSVRMRRIISATRSPAHESFMDELSMPRKTVLSGSSARTMSAEPISWMQWSAVNTAS